MRLQVSYKFPKVNTDSTHTTPEIPAIMTPSALQTFLILPDALLLVGVLITCRSLSTASMEKRLDCCGWCHLETIDCQLQLP